MSHIFERLTKVLHEGGCYPEDAKMVSGYDDEGNMLVSSIGGGLVSKVFPHAQGRFREVTSVDRIPRYRKAAFEIECFDDERFSGWTDGGTWNGWAKPLFPLAEALRLQAFIGEQLWYDAASDSFVDVSSGDEEHWTGKDIVLWDGTKEHVYDCGAGSWTWDEVEDMSNDD